MDDGSSSPAFLELPAVVLRQVVLCLDGRDVDVLSGTCKALNAVCEDLLLWKELALRRFGKSVLPGMQPSPGACR